MTGLKKRTALVAGILAVAAFAATADAPFTLPPSARIAETRTDGRGWKASGEIALSFQQAQRGLAGKVAAAGWRHLHTIKMGKDRVLEAWSRGEEELTVMVWRLAPGRSGFSYGLSKKAKGGK